MNDNNFNRKEDFVSLGFWVSVLLASILCLSILGGVSCTRKVYIPLENTIYRTDTLRTNTLRVDSIVLHDSIAFVQKGDTIMITKYRDRYRYVNRTDTAYISRTDSVLIKEPYPVETIRMVEKSLAWWQTTLLWIGVASLLIFAIIVYNKFHNKKL